MFARFETMQSQAKTPDVPRVLDQATQLLGGGERLGGFFNACHIFYSSPFVRISFAACRKSCA